jgi:hypothetical protein
MKVGCQNIPDLGRRKTTTIAKGYQQTFPGSQGLKVRITGTGVVMHSVLTVDHDAAAANHLVLAPAKYAKRWHRVLNTFNRVVQLCVQLTPLRD